MISREDRAGGEGKPVSPLRFFFAPFARHFLPVKFAVALSPETMDCDYDFD